MGISREPGLQRRRRLGPGGVAQSCSSLLCGPGPQDPLAEPTARRTAPPAASRTPSDPGSPADSGPPTVPRPAADPRPSSAKPRPSKLDSQTQLSRPLTAAPDGRQPSANEVLRWRAGLKVGGQRSGSQRSEYNRQFSWKKPATAASPILTAEQMLHSSSRCVPPFKKHPIPMETEYQRNFQGLAPPTEPRLRKHLEHHQRAPLFHIHTANKKRREGSEKKPRPKQDFPAPKNDSTTPPPPPQVQRGHRITEGDGATDGDAHQSSPLTLRLCRGLKGGGKPTSAAARTDETMRRSLAQQTEMCSIRLTAPLGLWFRARDTLRLENEAGVIPGLDRGQVRSPLPESTPAKYTSLVLTSLLPETPRSAFPPLVDHKQRFTHFWQVSLFHSFTNLCVAAF
uniref:Nuclear protein MDM1 n=1 Tax=Cyclopterus lumpus TaxID=8103 RepID=A0A8C3AII5_CYCLU